MPMAVVMTSSASEMKKIFDLCDKNGDGLINREDFKNIGGEHFDGEQVKWLGYAAFVKESGLWLSLTRWL